MSLESLHSSVGDTERASATATAPAVPHLDRLQVITQLYKTLPLETATNISRRERMENGYSTTTLSYGEVEYEDFIEHLEVLYKLGFPETGGRFVDIGCGTGKAIFAAALWHNFEICTGIEILEGLHASCVKVLQHWKRLMIKHEDKQNIEIQFTHGDLTIIDWSDANIIFANSTCFDDPLMEKIARLAERTRPGTFILTTTNRVPSEEIELLEVRVLRCRWGECESICI